MTEEADKCLDCGSPMMEVCSGLEKISRESCQPVDPRIVEFFNEIGIGYGDDPIAFLIASHRLMAHQRNEERKWGEDINDAPQDGTEVIFWVSSEKGFPDQTSNFFFMPDTDLNRKVYGDKVGCWYWSESEEPLNRPDLVKGWKIYPQPPDGVK